MESMLFKIVKARKHPVGCVIAKRLGDTIYVTGSLCHRRMDRFSKERAIGLAEDRAQAMYVNGRFCEVPASLRYDIEVMQDRAYRYFGGTKVVVAPIKVMPPPRQGPDLLEGL